MCTILEHESIKLYLIPRKQNIDLFTDGCFLFKLITSNRLRDNNYNRLLVRNSIVLCTSFLKYFFYFCTGN